MLMIATYSESLQPPKKDFEEEEDGDEKNLFLLLMEWLSLEKKTRRRPIPSCRCWVFSSRRSSNGRFSLAGRDGLLFQVLYHVNECIVDLM
ncbi:hypothetical protein CIPAW_13G015800 [Carya illinoinensis]|uniref:Uncharacterized protein n=1 Tax=Carya illinoinensis TaxID=32201 RepID=A0A8T1NL36_CARIL|nr:hypothetical protein CIPAW_13G015800 [Carya illinoinensis]